MFGNQVLTALRLMLKNKTATIINIAGLAVGISCCVMAALFIRYELGYDKQGKEAQHIYRIVSDFRSEDSSAVAEATTPPALVELISQNFPEINQATRVFSNWGNTFEVRVGEKHYFEKGLLHVDSNFFKVFPVSFLRGQMSTALNRPDGIVLSQTTAIRYFGKEDPMGKVLLIDDWAPCIVTGVISDWYQQSHLAFDALIPLHRFLDDRSANNWDWQAFYSYICVREGVNIQLLDSKIGSLSKIESRSNKYAYSLQPLTTIHLYSDRNKELKLNGNASYLYIFATVALLVLIISSLNYVGLTTANVSLRSKEIAIRKLSGGNKLSLIKQLLLESICLTLMAGVVGLVLVEFAIPTLNSLTGTFIVLSNDRWSIIFLTLLSAAILGAIAGLYPALLLASQPALNIIKGTNSSGSKTLPIRKTLVVTQFVIASILVIATLLIQEQVSFIQQKDVGLDKDHVLLVNANHYLKNQETSHLKNEWEAIPGVKSVSAADGIVIDRNWPRAVKVSAASPTHLVDFLTVDSNFVNTLNISLLTGRNFRHSDLSDTVQSIILNETAVRELEISAPVLGRRLIWRVDPQTQKFHYATVVGIMKDFHFSSMRNKITPFALVYADKRKWMYTIRIDGSNTERTVSNIRQVWEKNVRSSSFQHSFLNDHFGKLYEADIRFNKIFNVATYVAIFLASVGLLGLVVFAIRKREKEITIRRILGASTGSVLQIFISEFALLMLLACLISFPIAGWLMFKWLQQYAYHVSITLNAFITAALLMMFIAFTTTAAHAIIAARRSVVQSLRS